MLNRHNKLASLVVQTNQAPAGAQPVAPVQVPPAPKPAAAQPEDKQSTKQWEARPQRKAADGSLEVMLSLTTSLSKLTSKYRALEHTA